jgi:hypothetical protein
MRLIRKAGGRSRVVVVLAAMALPALTMTAAAQAKGVKGTVVHHNARAGSFVVAGKHGRLYAVHSASSPALGSKVNVKVRKLKNGTFASTRAPRGGKHQSRVRAHGAVSHVNGAAHTFTLSARGVSLTVKQKLGASAPPIGENVTVTGAVDDENEGQIEEEDLQEEGEDANGFEVEGVILEINDGARTLTIGNEDNQGDEAGELEEKLIVHVPASLSLSVFKLEEEVDLNVTPLGNNEFELLGSASDEGEEGAEDQNEDEQGEQGDENEGENGDEDQNEDQQ